MPCTQCTCSLTKHEVWEFVGGPKYPSECSHCHHQAAAHNILTSETKMMEAIVAHLQSKGLVRSEGKGGTKRPRPSVSEDDEDEVKDGYYSGKNRNEPEYKAFCARILARDGKCIVSGDTTDFEAAHIVPLEKISVFHCDEHYQTYMGIALRADLHKTYANHEWYFKSDGTIVRLFPNTSISFPKPRIELPNVNEEALLLKEKLALANAEGRCQLCWAKVGEKNMARHLAKNCGRPEEEDHNAEVASNT